jgi:hypothetical protein
MLYCGSRNTSGTTKLLAKKTSGIPPASHGWDRTLNLSLQLRKHQTIRNAKQKGGGLEQ